MGLPVFRNIPQLKSLAPMVPLLGSRAVYTIFYLLKGDYTPLLLPMLLV